MYADNWNAYYRRNYQEAGDKALWDVAPPMAAARDLEYFAAAFDPALPLIDLGCGTGEQAAFLHDTFPRVIGVDVANVAVGIAADLHQGSGLSFQALDATDPGRAACLHATFGDANIYMRGVVHQILPEDLEDFRQTLRILLGRRGRCYFNEVSTGIREYFTESSDRFAALPVRMQRVFLSNLPPRGVDLSRLDDHFPSGLFTFLTSAEHELATNLSFQDGSPIFIPSVRGLFRSAFPNHK